MSNLSFWGKLNKLREIKLDNEHRAELRAGLTEFINMDEQAARVDDVLRHQMQARHKVLGDKKSIWTSLIKSNSIINFRPMPIFAGLVIAIMAGGGVSFAAENSLPGDVLYSVKVGVNEEVRGAVIFSSEAKAEWEARRVERRLEEAAKLAASGDISAEVSSNIEENFEAHAKKVEDRIARFESENKITAAADLASKFETSLRAHDQILERLALRSVSQTALKSEIESSAATSADAPAGLGLGPIKIRVKRHLSDVEAKRVRFDDEIKTKNGSAEVKAEIKAAAEGGIGAAKNAIASVKSYIEKQKAKLGVGATADAEARLGVAESLVAQAEAKVTAGKYGEAFNLANESLRVAQAARVLVNASTELNLKIRLLGPEIEIEIDESDDDTSVNTAIITDNEENDNEDETEVKAESETEVETNGRNTNASSGLRFKIGL